MNDDETMLYYKGRTLIAKYEGVGLELGALPLMDELPKNTTEIHFYPARSEYLLRENAKPNMREMRAPEIDAVVGLLKVIAEFGKRILRGNK